MKLTPLLLAVMLLVARGPTANPTAPSAAPTAVEATPTFGSTTAPPADPKSAPPAAPTTPPASPPTIDPTALPSSDPTVLSSLITLPGAVLSLWYVIFLGSFFFLRVEGSLPAAELLSSNYVFVLAFALVLFCTRKLLDQVWAHMKPRAAQKPKASGSHQGFHGRAFDALYIIPIIFVIFTVLVNPTNAQVTQPAPQTSLFIQDGLGYSGILTNYVPLTGVIEMQGYSFWPSGFNKVGAAFIGGVFDGSFVWMIPFSADRVMRVRTSDGNMQGYNTWPSGFTKATYAFVGGVYDGTYVWMIPYFAVRVVRVRTSDGTMQGYSTWPSGFIKEPRAFVGGAYDGTFSQPMRTVLYDFKPPMALCRGTIPGPPDSQRWLSLLWGSL